MGVNPNLFHHCIWKQRLGNRPGLGFRAQLNKKLYSSIECVNSWDPFFKGHEDVVTGGIFNFDFSPDGSLLAAACEKKNILLFDPFNGKLLKQKNQAHSDCVNCVRFLDSRMFATCSDDTTVSLWDARYLKHKIRTLKGHSSWVKNIEYSQKHQMLVTSGFDGSVYAWDINKYTETECSFQRVIYTKGLMRTKLTPDNTRLVMTTSDGFLMVVHNLDLLTLQDDMNRSLGQLTNNRSDDVRHIPMKRNRMEYINDFPEADQAEMITSLEVHPQGWCAASRNTTSDEDSEWTCVHDIQEIGASYKSESEDKDNLHSRADPNDDAQARRVLHDKDMPETSANPQTSSSHFTRTGDSPYRVSINIGNGRDNISVSNAPNHSSEQASFSDEEEDSDSDHHSAGTYQAPVYRRQTEPSFDFDDDDDDEASEPFLNSQPSVDRQEPSSDGHIFQSFSSPSTSTAYRNDSRIAHQEREPETHRPLSPAPPSMNMGDAMTIILHSGSRMEQRSFQLLRRDVFFSNLRYSRFTLPRLHLPPNSSSRLNHYIEEPNVGRGFIKEICFSQDGRIICSPFSFGIRLLTFDPSCNDLCDTVPSVPKRLYELKSILSHSQPVVTTKFSPIHCMVVSGCLGGKIDFHQPKLG